MITTIYHVSVSGSRGLCDALSRDSELDRKFDAEVSQARGNAVESGCNTYDTLDEWAEFHELSDAKQFETKLKAIIAKYEPIARDWHKAQESED